MHVSAGYQSCFFNKKIAFVSKLIDDLNDGKEISSVWVKRSVMKYSFDPRGFTSFGLHPFQWINLALWLVSADNCKIHATGALDSLDFDKRKRKTVQGKRNGDGHLAELQYATVETYRVVKLLLIFHLFISGDLLSLSHFPKTWIRWLKRVRRQWKFNVAKITISYL